MNKILLVDLNNFSRYPTISIGLLTAILRQSGFDVDVFSPLAMGVTGTIREQPVPAWGLMLDRIKFRSAMSDNRWLKAIRDTVTKSALHAPKLAVQQAQVAQQIATRLDASSYDVVLVSSYLMYFELCSQIASICEQRQKPVVFGGPYFAQPEVRAEWLKIRGLTALVGGEVEPYLADLVRAAIGGKSLAGFAGVWVPGAKQSNAPPLKDLDAIPFPDYSDFPWEKYPNRIVPIITGRGCGWGACTFCSDVTGTAHRTFRSRSANNVLDEVQYQNRQFGAKLFVFTDPKLNSDLGVWDGLISEMQNRVPGSTWIAAVHIDSARPRNGLAKSDLDAARESGMVRLTTGLESGSQRVLDLMKKGAQLDVSSRAIRDAAAAGISVRVTMIVGYPKETAADVWRTAEFLERHHDAIERVSLSRFFIRTGTRFDREYKQDPAQYPEIYGITTDDRTASVEHSDMGHKNPAYRRAIDEVLRVVHAINRRPIRESARQFDGVM